MAKRYLALIVALLMAICVAPNALARGLFDGPAVYTDDAEGAYVLVTDIADVTTGDYIIYSTGLQGEYSAAMGNTIKSGRLGAVEVSIVDDTVLEPTAAIIWHFEAQQDGSFTVYNAAAAKYLKVAGSNTSGLSLTDTAECGFTVEEAVTNDTSGSKFLYYPSENSLFIRTTDESQRVLCLYRTDFRNYNPNTDYYDTFLYKYVEGAVTPDPTPEPTPAPEPVVFTVGTVEGVEPGDTVTVPVTLAGDYEAHTLTAHIGYNSTYLTLNSITAGELIANTDGAMLMPDVSTPGSGAIGMLAAMGGVTGTGVLVNLSFTVSADCTEDQPVTMTVDEFFYMPLTETTPTPIAYSIVNGVIEIEYTPEPTPVPELGDYVLVTDLAEITTGDYVIYGVKGDVTGAMSAVVNEGKMAAEHDVTVVENTIVDPAASIVWHIEALADGTYTIYNSAVGYCWIEGNTTSGFKTGETSAYAFTIEYKDEEAHTLKMKSTADYNRMITLYGDDFRSYADNASNYKPLYLYKYTGETPEPTYYTVSFYDWDGTLLSTQQVVEGGAATAPADPTREGYTFIGWDTDFSNVTSNLIVTALYEEDVPPVTILLGDVDCNGEVNMADLALASSYVQNTATVTDQGVLNGDVNGDGLLTIADLAGLYNIVLG